MKVQSVGYFKEMPHAFNAYASIYDYVNQEKQEMIDDICNYLDSGLVLIMSPGVINDIINPDNGIAGDTSVYTDGKWIWPGDLSYYVRNYRLKLPDEFISTMSTNNWHATITIDDLYDLNCNDLEIDGIKI